MLHKCIKSVCENSYESNDADSYYCPSCLEAKNKIAKEIDLKFANRPKRESEGFEDKIAGMKKLNGITMINL